MAKKQMMAGVVCMLFLIMGIGIARSFMNFAAKEEVLNKFQPVVHEYLNAELDKSWSEGPYRVGKVVMVDVDKEKADYWTHPKLPLPIQATSPEAVETVVLVEWQWDKVGHYEDAETGDYSGEAKKVSAQVTVVDWHYRRVVGSKFFEGKEPPKGLQMTGDYAYERPMFKVVDWVKSLPKK